jgi:hypothetical protein
MPIQDEAWNRNKIKEPHTHIHFVAILLHPSPQPICPSFFTSLSLSSLCAAEKSCLYKQREGGQNSNEGDIMRVGFFNSNPVPRLYICEWANHHKGVSQK